MEFNFHLYVINTVMGKHIMAIFIGEVHPSLTTDLELYSAITTGEIRMCDFVLVNCRWTDQV